MCYCAPEPAAGVGERHLAPCTSGGQHRPITEEQIHEGKQLATIITSRPLNSPTIHNYIKCI